MHLKISYMWKYKGYLILKIINRIPAYAKSTMAFNCLMDSSDWVFSILRATVYIKALFSYHLGLETVQASSTSPVGRFHTQTLMEHNSLWPWAGALPREFSDSWLEGTHVFLAISQLGLEEHTCFPGEAFWRTTMMLFCHRNHMLPSRMCARSHSI